MLIGKLTRLFTRKKTKKRKKGDTAAIKRRQVKLEKMSRVLRQFHDLLFDPALTGRKKQALYAERGNKYNAWKTALQKKAEKLYKAKKKFNPLEKEADLKQGDRFYARTEAWHRGRGSILTELRSIRLKDDFRRELNHQIAEYGKKPNSPPHRVKKQFYEFLKRSFEEGGFAKPGVNLEAFFEEYIDEHFSDLSVTLY